MDQPAWAAIEAGGLVPASDTEDRARLRQVEARS
jgi:hypothetical protein